MRLLVLCTGNTARSQIAEALLVTRGAGRVHAESAGSHPKEAVHPGALRVLREHGVEWEGRTPRGIDAVSAGRWDLVLTVCDNARESCPVLPGAPAMAHWSLDDPAGAEGDAATARAFAETYRIISENVDALLSLPLETLRGAELARRVTAIHERG